MDMSKYKGMFISETKEHLQTMNSLIISLEKTPEGKEDIEALFREAHSIKGMAASMGYDPISELSHKMEDMMDLFRKGELKLDSEAVDILFQALDSLENMHPQPPIRRSWTTCRDLSAQNFRIIVRLVRGPMLAQYHQRHRPF